MMKVLVIVNQLVYILATLLYYYFNVHTAMNVQQLDSHSIDDTISLHTKLYNEDTNVLIMYDDESILTHRDSIISTIRKNTKNVRLVDIVSIAGLAEGTFLLI